MELLSPQLAPGTEGDHPSRRRPHIEGYLSPRMMNEWPGTIPGRGPEGSGEQRSQAALLPCEVNALQLATGMPPVECRSQNLHCEVVRFTGSGQCIVLRLSYTTRAV